MRIAALLVALLTIVIGIGGIMSPDRGTEIRRLYFATPVRLYTAAAFRVAMGLVVILSATGSRAPKTMRALGALMCMQGSRLRFSGLSTRARSLNGKRGRDQHFCASVRQWRWQPVAS